LHVAVGWGLLSKALLCYIRLRSTCKSGGKGGVPRDLLPTDLAHNGRRTVTHARRAPETGGRDNRTSGGVRLPYLPGLDGLRALAVAAVLLYHAGLP
jgi:hypothetical protein